MKRRFEEETTARAILCGVLLGVSRGDRDGWALMSPELIAAVERERGKPRRWFYLSFADEARFLGAAIVFARGVASATVAARGLGINPGGQVLAAEIPREELPAKKYRARLLLKDEIKEFWPDSMSIREHAAEGRHF